MIVKRTRTRQKHRKQLLDQQKQAQQTNTPTKTPWQNHPAYRQWIREFFQTLFDFEFRQSITVKMLPLLYGVGIIASGGLAIYCISSAFLSSLWHGIGFLLVLGPLIFIFCTAALRSTLEFFSAVFRIQHNMHQLLGALGGMRHELRSMQQDMSGLAKAVEEVAVQAGEIASTINEAKAVIGEFEGFTDRIPFFRKPKKAEKADRDKNWAEAPLAEQYDLEKTDPKSRQRTRPTKNKMTPQVDHHNHPHHDHKRSKLVDLKSGRESVGKTLKFQTKEAANQTQGNVANTQRHGHKNHPKPHPIDSHKAPQKPPSNITELTD